MLPHRRNPKALISSGARRDVCCIVLLLIVVLAVSPFVIHRQSEVAPIIAARRIVSRERLLSSSSRQSSSSDVLTTSPLAPLRPAPTTLSPAALGVVDASTSAPLLFRPAVDRSTPHYNFSVATMPDAFLDHLQNMTRRIHKQWSAKGWKRFDKEDISNCSRHTPECQLFREILPSPSGDAAMQHAFTKCCVEHRLLREVAVWTLDRLNAWNVSYFLSTGTALGALRHGGVIIPWDTDVDIAISPVDKEIVERALKDNGVRYFHRDPLGKPMFWVHHSRNGKPSFGPHIEIFYDPVYTKYPQKLLPLEPCAMYEHTVHCPNREMLNVWFPSGWQVYGGGHYHGDHRCTIYQNGRRYETDKC